MMDEGKLHPSAQGLSFIEWDTGVPEREVIIKTNLKSDKTEKYGGINRSRMRIEIVKQNLLHIQCCRPCACRQRERAHHPYLDCEIGEVGFERLMRLFAAQGRENAT